MATPLQLRAMVTARPFRPFFVRCASGQFYLVEHPENVACSPDGQEMALFEGKDMHLLDMLLVEALEPVPTPAPAPEDN